MTGPTRTDVAAGAEMDVAAGAEMDGLNHGKSRST